MKSSTFSFIFIGLLVLLYGIMAVEDQMAEKQDAKRRDFIAARAYCGNASWTTEGDGETLTITCIRRIPLRIGKSK